MSPELERALADHKIIRLDMGAGKWKQEGFFAMDKRAVENVDLVHDLEVFPYPLPDECCHLMLASHVVEHLKPWLMIDIMNEWWRLLIPGGKLMLAMPYPTSDGFYQDPTHIKAWSERTPYYFDPESPLYQIYEPKPWKIERGFPQWVGHGNIEIVMVKRELS